MAFISDEPTEEVCDWVSGFMSGCDVVILLDGVGRGLLVWGTVVAVGANPVLPAGTVPVCVTV